MGRSIKQLADDVARELNFHEREARRFARRFLQLVAEDLITTGHVDLRGLGSFALSTRKARKGRHPKTGKPIKIAATRFVRFRTSVTVRRRLNPKPPPVPPAKKRPSKPVPAKPSPPVEAPPTKTASKEARPSTAARAKRKK